VCRRQLQPFSAAKIERDLTEHCPVVAATFNVKNVSTYLRLMGSRGEIRHVSGRGGNGDPRFYANAEVSAASTTLKHETRNQQGMDEGGDRA
jgi:hypothetical protein